MYPDLKTVDNHGNSVLHIAAQNGRAGIIEDLILNGADVNYGNNHQNTAIHLAAQNGWDEVAGHLLRAKKLKVNYKDLHANTALHLAAQNGQLGVSFGDLNFYGSEEPILPKPQLPGRLFSPSDICKKLSHHFLLHFLIGMGSYDHHSKYQGVYP